MSDTWQVDLVAGTGAGAFGRAATFREAHRVAWAEWLRAFGTTGPHEAHVDGPRDPRGRVRMLETDDELSYEEAALVAPPAEELAASLPHRDWWSTLPANSADEVDADSIDAYAEEVAANLRGAREAWADGKLARARLEVTWAMRQLLDLDRDLRAAQIEAAAKRCGGDQ